MKDLKQIFPFSFLEKDSVVALIIHILVYLIAGSVISSILGIIPLIGGILGWIASIYCTMGWVITILDYVKVLK